jgi:Ig-like domain CHU_C associated
MNFFIIQIKGLTNTQSILKWLTFFTKKQSVSFAAYLFLISTFLSFSHRSLAQNCTLSNNPSTCQGVTNIGFWMKTVPGYGGAVAASGMNFSLSGGSMVQNGTSATISATLTGLGASGLQYSLVINLSGGTSSGQSGHNSDCSGYVVSKSDWYYYTSSSGSLTSIGASYADNVSLSQMGGAFQIGTGANLWDASVYGGAGWFSLNGSSQCDFGGVIDCPVIDPCPGLVTATNDAVPCDVTSIQLRAVSSGTTGAVSYRWTGPNGFVSSVQNPISTSSAGTYTVTAKYNNNVCSTSDLVTVAVYQTPNPPVASSVTRCDAGTVTLTASGCASSSQTRWYNATGTLLKLASSYTTPSLSVTTSYQVRCYGSGACLSAVTTVNAVIGSPPSISVNAVSICNGQSASLTTVGCNGGTVTWNTGTTGTILTVSPNTTTTYTATCISSGCAVVSASGIVTVNTIPTLSLIPTCTVDGLTYNVAVTTDATTILSDKGTVFGNTVTGISTGQMATITATSSSGCSITKTTIQNCTPSCVQPDAGIDVSMCLPKTTTNLVDAPVGYQWVASSSNPISTNVNTSTGLVIGMSVTGTYQYMLQKIGDVTCFDIVQVKVIPENPPIILCNDGTSSYKIVAPTYLSNVIWYNMAGQQVGAGASLVITSNTLGLADGTEYYYYKGDFGTPNVCECDIELCCPVKITTKYCCPTPNCIDVTGIK